jgi:hypothetical protein
MSRPGPAAGLFDDSDRSVIIVTLIESHACQSVTSSPGLKKI